MRFGSDHINAAVRGKDHAVVTLRRLARDVTLAQVPCYGVQVALERIAPSAAAIVGRNETRTGRYMDSDSAPRNGWLTRLDDLAVARHAVLATEQTPGREVRAVEIERGKGRLGRDDFHAGPQAAAPASGAAR